MSGLFYFNWDAILLSACIITAIWFVVVIISEGFKKLCIKTWKRKTAIIPTAQRITAEATILDSIPYAIQIHVTPIENDTLVV
jgi:hypothetical protein